MISGPRSRGRWWRRQNWRSLGAILAGCHRFGAISATPLIGSYMALGGGISAWGDYPRSIPLHPVCQCQKLLVPPNGSATHHMCAGPCDTGLRPIPDPDQ